MPYIQRYADGGLAIFAHRQKGIAEEFVPEDDPILVGKGQTIEQTREMVREQIKNYATDLRNKVTGGCSTQEAAAWVVKLEEVKAYRKNPAPESAPLLNSESQFRNVNLPKMIEMVEAKAATFLEFEARISGVRGFHEDKLDKLKTIEKILDYDWKTKWKTNQN